MAAAAGTGFSPEGVDISIIRITEPRAGANQTTNPAGLSARVSPGEADVAALTRPGTGNNAFPSYGPDGSEVRCGPFAVLWCTQLAGACTCCAAFHSAWLGGVTCGGACSLRLGWRSPAARAQ